MSALNYRPEIDGLRAIAVVGVILYHAGVPFTGGGFVGVDIFFVISGFLITSLIVKDLEVGTFSFKAFWQRRARRILPAQLTVMAATLCTCAYFYFAKDAGFVVEQAFSQLAFVSNIFYYFHTNYFGTDQSLKPLLHFWSLAVEEQFYIVFPFILWGLSRVKGRAMLSSLVALGVLSFAACLWIVRGNCCSAA